MSIFFCFLSGFFSKPGQRRIGFKVHKNAHKSIFAEGELRASSRTERKVSAGTA